MIAREKDFFIQKIEDYKTQAKFAPLCIGFYRMSGTIGKRRAKRAIHLLNQSTEEGTNFIIYILSTLSASTLHSYLLNNDKAKSVIQHVKEQKLENPNFKLAVEVFTNFLNVINYPGEKFKDSVNKIISQFSFEDLTNDKSNLVKEIKKLHAAMHAELSAQQVRSVRGM